MASDPPTFAVPPGFLGFGRREHAAISIAGIPLDIGTTNRSGARFGPQAIRHASRMLVDGEHPTAWINVSKLMLSDIGDFRIALGDIPASLKAIEEQAAAVDHLVALGGEHGITLALLRALSFSLEMTERGSCETEHLAFTIKKACSPLAHHYLTDFGHRNMRR